jgi:hypothetical protein
VNVKLAQHANQQSVRPTAAARQAQSVLQRDSGSSNPMLYLQRTRGNQFVQYFLQSQTVQRKIAVNEPGDRFEQEANRMADHVMRMPAPETRGPASVTANAGASLIQRACSKCQEEQQAG